MAFKKVLDTTKTTYLNSTFEDEKGNRYSDFAAGALVGWYRFTPGAPTNLSDNTFRDDEDPPAAINVAAAYPNARPPVVGKAKIGKITYDIGTFHHHAATGASMTIGLAGDGSSSGWDHIIGNEPTSTKKMTVSVWIFKTGEGGGNPIPRIFEVGALNDPDIYLSFDSQNYNVGQLQFGVKLNGVLAKWTTDDSVVKDNEWTHVAVSYDGSNSLNSDAKIYINGELKETSFTISTGHKHATYSGIAHDSLPFVVGNNSNAYGRGFEGSMAEFCVWNQVLTQENIRAIYNASQNDTIRTSHYSGFLNHSPRIQSIDSVNYHDRHGAFNDTSMRGFVDPRYVSVIEFVRAPRDGTFRNEGITISENRNSTSKSKKFEFQRGVILGPGNISVDIRRARTPAQCAEKFVEAVNQNTEPGWSFSAELITPTRVKLIRNSMEDVGKKFLYVTSNTMSDYSNKTVSVRENDKIVDFEIKTDQRSSVLLRFPYGSLPVDNQTIGFASADNVTRTYRLGGVGTTTGALDNNTGHILVNNHFPSGQTAELVLSELRDAILSNLGHTSSRIEATLVDNNTGLLLTQVTPGNAGNTAITENLTGLQIAAGFSNASGTRLGERKYLVNAYNSSFSSATCAQQIVNTVNLTESFHVVAAISSSTVTLSSSLNNDLEATSDTTAITIRGQEPSLDISIREKFVREVSPFKAGPRSFVNYPSLDIARSQRSLNRGKKSIAFDGGIRIVRPVSRMEPETIVVDAIEDPYNEALSQAAFGFEEGADGVSPERDQDSSFYQSGSFAAVSASSVRTKKQIVIDMPVSTGSNEIVASMAYYNFDLSKWEIVGNLPDRQEGSTNGNRLTDFKQYMQSQMIGFTPSARLECFNATQTYSGVSFNEYFEVTGSGDNTIKGNGRVLGAGSLASPTNVFGFPMAPRFHATGSQHIDMSTKIDKPFVLEKIVVETTLRSKHNTEQIRGGHPGSLQSYVNGALPGIPTPALFSFEIFPDQHWGNGTTGQIVLTSTDGTTRTYIGRNSEDLAQNQFNYAANSWVQSLTNCILSDHGHAGKIIPHLEASEQIFHLTQATPGSEGETRVDITAAGPGFSSYSQYNAYGDPSAYYFKSGGASGSKALTSETPAEGPSVDLDTYTMFILNQRLAGTGAELNSLPEVTIGDGGTRKSPSEAGTDVVSLISEIGQIPQSVQLTARHKLNDGSYVTPAPTTVSTMRDLVTYARLTVSPKNFDEGLYDTGAKDLRKSSDFVVEAEHEYAPFKVPSLEVKFRADARGWEFRRLRAVVQSADGTVKHYVIDERDPAGAGSATGTVVNGEVVVNTYGVANNGIELASRYETALKHSNGHAGKIRVTRSDRTLTLTNTILFDVNYQGNGPVDNADIKYADSEGSKFSISAPCRAPVSQNIHSSNRKDGAPALFRITNGFFEMSGNTLDVTGTPSDVPQFIQASKANLGRTLADIQSGREISGENASSETLYTMRGNGNADLKITAYEFDAKNSPYVILPGDKLIFGWQSPVPTTIGELYDGETGNARAPARSSILSFASGDSRVILYGYELQGERESDRNYSAFSTGNSKFFSEGVGDIRVRDQFETHPRMAYYGSSLDEVVTGSMKPTIVGDAFTTDEQSGSGNIKAVRQVVGKNSQGTQGKKGSLLRGRKATDSGEIYYDSMAPSLRGLMNVDRVRMLDITTGSAGPNISSPSIVLGMPGSSKAYADFHAANLSGEKPIWDNWYSSFPFEPRYSGINRTPVLEKNIQQTTFNDDLSSKTREQVAGVAIALFDNVGDLKINGGTLNTGAQKQFLPSPSTATQFYNDDLINSEAYVTWRTNAYGDNDSSLEPQDPTTSTATMKLSISNFALNGADQATLNSQPTTAHVVEFSLAGVSFDLGFNQGTGTSDSNTVYLLDDRILGEPTVVDGTPSELVRGRSYKIASADNTDWSSVGGPNPAAVDQVFVANATNASGALGKVRSQPITAEDCAKLVEFSLLSAFAGLSDVSITRTGSDITITVTNRAWMTTPQTGGYVQLTQNGSPLASTDFLTQASEFSGNDLVKITGAPLTAISVRKAVGNNDDDHLETVAFASILADQQPNRLSSETVDIDLTSGTKSVAAIHELGSTIESDLEYYGKLFFGAGDGKFKSPIHKISQPSDVSLNAVDNHRIAVKHGFVSSPYNLACDFILHQDDGFENTRTYTGADSLMGWWKLGAHHSNVLADTSSAGTLALTAPSEVNERTIVIRNGEAGYNGTTLNKDNTGGSWLATNATIHANVSTIDIKHAVTLGGVTQIDAQDTYMVTSYEAGQVTLTRVSPANKGGQCSSVTGELPSTIDSKRQFKLKKDTTDVTTVELAPPILASAMAASTVYEVVTLGNTTFDGAVGSGYSDDPVVVGTTFTSPGSPPSSSDGEATVRLAASGANKIVVKITASQADVAGSSDSGKSVRDLMVKAFNGVEDSSIVYATSGNGVAGVGIPGVFALRKSATNQFEVAALDAGSANNFGSGTGYQLSTGIAGGSFTDGDFASGRDAPSGTSASYIALRDGSYERNSVSNSFSRSTPSSRVSLGSNEFNGTNPNQGYRIGSAVKWDSIIGNTVAVAAEDSSEVDHGKITNLTNGTGDGAPSDDGTGKMTFAAWIKPTDSTKSFSEIFGMGSWSGTMESGIQIFVSGGRLQVTNRFGRPDGNLLSQMSFTTSPSINDNLWHHVVVTYDISRATIEALNQTGIDALISSGGSNYTTGADYTGINKSGLQMLIKPKIYLDGVELAVTRGGGSNPNYYWGGIRDEQNSAEVAECILGGLTNDAQGAYTFAGEIAEAAIWKDVLSQSDILAIYDSTCPSYINASSENPLSTRFTTVGIGTTSTPEVVYAPTTSDHQLFSGYTVRDKLLSFDSSTSARQITLIEEVKAGQMVSIKIAGASFTWNTDYGGGNQAPRVNTSLDNRAEIVERDAEALRIVVSTDGGSTWQDVDDLATDIRHESDFDTTGTHAPATGLIQGFRGNGNHPISDRMSAGAFKLGKTANDAASGPEHYPSIKFVAPTDLKVAVRQAVNNGLSYDHFFCRYLSFRITQGDAESASDVFNVPRTGKANYSMQARAEKIVLRGSKYGLISPVKLNTSAIFRAGSFGNHRDMLEQRQLTRTFDGTTPSEAPVQVSFLKRKEKTVVSPEETNSSNLDVFCTSSLPYFDGIVKDRTSQQPDLLDDIDVDIVTTVV